MRTTQSLGMTMNAEEDDDDLLSLDLDDDVNKIPSSCQRKDEDLFKKPAIPNFLLEEKEDEIISTFTSHKISANEQKLLSDMFLNDDEDEEDQFIASQIDLISSTQMNGNKVKSPPQEKPADIKKSDESVISMRSQETTRSSETPRLVKSPLKPLSKTNSELNAANVDTSKVVSINVTTAAKSNDLTMLEILANNKSWSHALNEMKKQFRSAGLESSLLQTYTLNHYYKKFFEYDLLMRTTDEGVRKLPMLCVWVKEITRKPTSATVLLTDFTSDIKGTIMSSFLKNKENFNYLMIGSVLFLKDVYLLQVNQNKNCYHLNINLKSIVNIFFPDLDETKGAINKLEVQSFGASDIRKLIDQFETNYTNFEYKPPAANDTTLNKTTGSKRFNTSSKSAPYQIPAHLNRTSNQVQRHGHSNTSTAAKPNGNNNQASKNLNSNQNGSNSNRNSQFNKSSVTSNDAGKTANISNVSHVDTSMNMVPVSQNNTSLFQGHSTQKSSSQSPLDQDMFSQLIFGIEDELLNDSG